MNRNYYNPLVQAAYPLLNAMPHIRHAAKPEDSGQLRQQLIGEIYRFEKQCQQAGFSYETILGARYCLCTSLDEAVALTSWGDNSIWSGNGLLVTFHKESSGGEKFFKLLDMLLQQPSKHIDLLELFYFCLLLGFGGRYRLVENGLAQLETLIQRLAIRLLQVRGEYSATLSVAPPSLPVNTDQPSRLSHFLLFCSLSCVLLTGLLYIGLNTRLNQQTEPVLTSIYNLPLPEATLPVERFSVAHLRQMLQSMLGQQESTVSQNADNVSVTLQGGNLFASASATLNPRYLAPLQDLAKQLNLTTGKIIVRGHSDNLPIHTHAYSSNYALSLARAETVAQQLRTGLRQPQRLQVESAGAQAPLVPNTNAKNRALNRRIEIIFNTTPDNSDQ
ncbi:MULTISPECIES: type IVB secretion system protein IcmH/DotU [Photorhabdus]|uniref:type IVB secretion system protein IcmH/DotU n=1 Tax=Photorhabdus TaxID=29487 RepID=UPI000DCCC91E|nr:MULTISPECIES: type IVB secretion system protein IcmH/DotU [Photorhabdus]MCT8342717.1 type IVB secretion system protein IcmH/DotU [Photorhabdus kleinii]RAW97762.1 type VI secretion system protein TssL [Photorhabdus sp. S10-54]RAW97843.1 type VI secretion system protein TssL [Photorhabdus sp. S9-53]RAX02081.1 type VI secretion system protein TssL [Photorhabdus sp. S8-52]